MSAVHTGSGAPLAGIRVLELGNFIAAPFAARVFADFGADVIKVEQPAVGDESRRWRLYRGQTSMLFRTLGRNKRSVTVDLHTRRGQELVCELARGVDVLVENFRPGTLERWGLGPDELYTVNPNVIMVRISGYGQTGPYRDYAGFGGVAEAFGGLRHITGDPAGPPVRPAASIGDMAGGLYGVIGALILLLQGRRGAAQQAPQVVDVALYEAVFSLLESLVPEYDAYGAVRQRTAGALPGVVPSGVYPCRDDRPVVIGGNANKVFGRLMVAIGRADLAADADLADNAGRAAHQQRIDDAIIAWTLRHPAEQVVSQLATAGVPASPLHDAASITTDPQYHERGMLQRCQVPVEDGAESVRFPGVVPQLNAAPAGIRWAGPDLGEHTDEILTELVGLSSAQCSELRSQGVI